MALGNHSPDQVWVRSSGVNLSLPIIIARDEECGLKSILLEGIKKLCSIVVRSVIICQRNHIVCNTVVDVISVRDGPFERPGLICSGWSRRSRI